MVLDWLGGTLAQYGDIIYAVWIIALTFLVGKTVFFMFQHYILNVKEGGEGLHEHVSREVKAPFYLIIGTIGLYYAARAINLLAPYRALIRDVFVVFGVLLGMYITRKAVNAIIVWYAARDKKRLKIEKTALMSLRNLIAIFIYATGAMIILGQLGVEVTPLLASLGIGGLAIAWALQPTLSSYFAGIYIASDKTVRLGDYIELDEEQRGYVEKMTWRTVWIRTLTGNMIVVPNSKLADSTLINYSQPKQAMLLKVPVGVAYGSDLGKVEKVALRVAKRIAKETESEVEGGEPFIRYREFGNSNINFNVLFKIKKWENQYELKHEFIKALKKEFDKEKIEISYPCTNVYMRGK